MKDLTIYWHKTNAKAKLPTKRDEDAGFDVYTIEDGVALMPHEVKLFSTGLQYAIDGAYWLMAFDRGSTGSRGIHTHCGVLDNGYRGEIFIALCNDNDVPVYFTSTVDKVEEQYITPFGKVLCYPTSKAIAQLIPVPLPMVQTVELTDEEEWQKMCNTERGEGRLGASGK